MCICGRRLKLSFQSSWQQTKLPPTSPQTGWSVRRKYLAARDVDIGVDSNIVIGTRSGHVFVGTRRTQTQQSFHLPGERALIWTRMDYSSYAKISNLQNIVMVVASVAVPFSAVRSDIRPHLPPTVSTMFCKRLLPCFTPEN
ncbi:hypothetical protein BASA83_012026 [Batrachochytrium salamandrivorans]|nr:hypothetical protein BASA83_012026 [Batrachochytrium salamandrivorans]